MKDQAFCRTAKFFKNRHKRLAGLLYQVLTDELRLPEMRDGVAREIVMELEIHALLEEQLLYPMLREAVRPESPVQTYIAVALETGQQLRLPLAALKRSGRLDSEHFRPLIQELLSRFEEHVVEVEHRLFPAITALPREKCERLEQESQQLLKTLQALPEYAGSRPEVVQDVRGGEQMRKKRAAV